MIEKLKELLLSVRFWQVTLVAGLQVLALYGFVPQDLTNVVSAWLGIVVTIGTVDSFARNLSKK